jgi:hypothetical protein
VAAAATVGEVTCFPDPPLVPTRLRERVLRGSGERKHETRRCGVHLRQRGPNVIRENPKRLHGPDSSSKPMMPLKRASAIEA